MSVCLHLDWNDYSERCVECGVTAQQLQHVGWGLPHPLRPFLDLPVDPKPTGPTWGDVFRAFPALRDV